MGMNQMKWALLCGMGRIYPWEEGWRWSEGREEGSNRNKDLDPIKCRKRLWEVS